jgi:hypothetical protein
MLCTGLVGCLNNDKAKDTRIGANKPLPGTPRLDANGNPVGVKTGQPANPYGNPYAGSNVQQTGGQLPPAGMGMGAGMTPNNGQYRTNGLNTNTGTAPPQNFGGPAGTPGGGASMGTPALPGYGQPVGGVTPSGYMGGANSGVIQTGGLASPPTPNLLVDPLPPPPPVYSGHGDSNFGTGAGAPIAPPTGLGPVAPPPPTTPTGKGPPLDTLYR